MAKFSSVALYQASGKMGGMVFNKNGTVRGSIAAKDPRSAAQQAVRNGFSAANVAWKALTPAQRAAWAALAQKVTLVNPVGKAYSPTGRRVYISCYQNALTATTAPTTTTGDAALGLPVNPPAFMPSVPDVGTLTATVTAATGTAPHGTILINCDFSSPGLTTVIRCTPMLSVDRNALGPGDFRVLMAHAPNTSPPAPGAVADLYAARFGAPVAGSRIVFEAFHVDPSGFVGPVTRVDATVGATAASALPAPAAPPEIGLRKAA